MSSIHESIYEPSPIIEAIENGLDLDAIKALLAAGYNVNYSSHIYGRPLMTACSHGSLSERLSVVELLLRHGADPNKGISGGLYDYITPLARCCGGRWGFTKEDVVQLCDLLISYGAFLDSTDGDDNERGGRSPLMVASNNGNLDLMRLLLDRGAGVDWRTYPESDLYALFDPLPPPPRVRLRTHWRLRILFHVVGRRACHPRSKRHELGQWRISDVAAFLLPRE
ncbi:unnamed protein product [Pelagomonas calceolata]|uniref:Ankyrin n=1 Tax=Pelagomonas calceolata TaxID=35677 RepID=A0A8J2SD22_9STRA|nr:unnamed protein product [Pelagomonas calceolata]